MPSPRIELADALADAAPLDVTVFAEEPGTPPALPALVVRPGSPYREAGELPHCLERWRLEVLALVAIDQVTPLDALDPLVDVARDVIRAFPLARYNGVRQPPGRIEMGGKSMRGAIVELDVETPED
jgi:hypothetical protein